MPKWSRWLYLSLVVLVLDQISKYWITEFFRHHEPLIVTSFFDLLLAYNKGAAFSMLAGASGWQRPLFTSIALIACAVILWLLRKHASNTWFCLGLALVLGGAMGNLTDRIAIGQVVDFIQLHAAGYYFPAFNVADSAISLGAALLIWDSVRAPSHAAAHAEKRGAIRGE